MIGTLLVLTLNLPAQSSGVEAVVAAIREVAVNNYTLPKNERVTGDSLCNLYVRKACETGCSAEQVILGLSYALEPSGIIATNPLTGHHFVAVETNEDREVRLLNLGNPTIRGRPDWLAHFFLSAGFTVALGERAAEGIGIQKEISDAIGLDQGRGTGFSFSDLNANFSGIAFAKYLAGLNSSRRIAEVGKSFIGEHYLPGGEYEMDSLGMKEFENLWGQVTGSKFLAKCDRMKEGVAEHTGLTTENLDSQKRSQKSETRSWGIYSLRDGWSALVLIGLIVAAFWCLKLEA